MEDLEEDPNVRQNVNIYKGERITFFAFRSVLASNLVLLDPSAMPVDLDDQDENFPKISLQEMLEGLNLAEDEEVVPGASSVHESDEGQNS